MTAPSAVSGAGLGLRRPLLNELIERAPPLGFLEVAPENWIGIGGRLGKQLRACTERYAFSAHGLSLSIGGPAPLDEAFLQRIRVFLDTHGIADYSEHLSSCGDDGHLYDLMPLPFTEEAVDYVAERVRRVQDILQRRIALENISYYAVLPPHTLSELDFTRAVLERAGCDLLLDVNNVYVNSVNHGYDARAFIDGLPAQRIRSLHVAGHHREAEDLCVDTHGAAVIDPVWALLSQAYERIGIKPTLLERDFNLPPLDELLAEVARVEQLQARHAHA